MLWSAHFTTQAFEECIQMYVLFQIEWNAQYNNRSNGEKRRISTTDTDEWEKKWQTIVVCEVYNRTLCVLCIYIQTNTHTLSFSLFHSISSYTYNGGLLAQCRYNRTLCTKSSILLLLIFFFSLGSLAYHLNEPVKRDMCGATTTSRTTAMMMTMLMVVMCIVYVCVWTSVCLSYFFFGIWMSSRVAAWIFTVITVSWMLGS